jgi:hypothetical protein
MTEQSKTITQRVECGLLSFSGCCHNNHRDCTSNEQLRAEHTPLVQITDLFTSEHKYAVSSKTPFRIQGILIWEPSPECCIKSIQVGNHEQLVGPEGAPASMFKSPFELPNVIQACNSQQLPYLLSAMHHYPIYMPTLTADILLTMTITGVVYDLIFWGFRLLSSSSPSDRQPKTDNR